MKKIFVVLFCFFVLIAYGNEFLMLYPNGMAIKGDQITVQSDSVELDIPDSWLNDSFTSTPNPTRYQHVVIKPFDYEEALKNAIGNKIRWRFDDGTIKEYQVLLDDPILLSDDNGVFSPKTGTAVFKNVQIEDKRHFLDLQFPKIINQLTYSYLFTNLSYSTVYLMNLDDDKKQAEIVGTLIIKNNTNKQIVTENLFIFSGSINTISTANAMKTVRSFSYAEESFSAGSSYENFNDYKIYNIPGSYSFEKTSTDYLHFFDNTESYEMIYTFNAYYSNHNSEFQAFDQTIKISKLSEPLMAGKIRLHRSDQEKTVFLGENTISNSSIGQPLEISFGKASDVQGKVELIQSNRSGSTYFEAYKFTVKNFSDEGKTIQLNFSIPRDSDVEVDVYEYSRPTASLLQIPLTLHANMEAEVTFEIRYDR